MAIADFIHLKVRSAYSLTEGANKVETVVALAKANAMPAVAVTDRNNLFGALEFAQYASKAGIQPIIGCDLGIRREEEGGIATVGKAPPADWLALLVQNETGYLNLMRLVSRAHLEFKTGSLPALCRSPSWRAIPRACWPWSAAWAAASAACWRRVRRRPRPISSSA